MSPLSLNARVEAAGIRAGDTVHQRDIDGWLVRYAPSRAKRSRCINARAMGSGSDLDTRIAASTALYRAAGLPVVFRVTPFSEPVSLDDDLHTRGWLRFDETQVMLATSLENMGVSDSSAAPLKLADVRVVPWSHAVFANWTATAQGWSRAEAHELASRLEQAPVRHQNLALVDPFGRAVACGQMAVDGDLVGLYSIYTASPLRRQGLGRRLCRELIARAIDQQATRAYLQVEATNDEARRLYATMGFEDAYRYHYRGESTPAAP